MCGIYLTNIPFEKDEIVEKLKSIEFRGPDNLGYEKVNDLSFGHLRLAILDLDERSNQPYSFDHLKIVFNGEIYNFQDIKKELVELGYVFETTSDTEVLIKGFSEWGKEMLPKLNGMFAFAIYDAKNNIVFCARDRMGVKPFFYYWKDGGFEICSQLRPLINAESKIAREVVSIYLDCGYIPSPYSIIEDIYKLPPGNFMEIDLGKKTKIISEFWNLKPVEIRNISYDDTKKELHELLIDAVKIRLQSDVPLGAFLSGGIDSALVSAIASKISKTPVNTFTIGFEDPKFDESKVAAQYAKIIGSNHTETICGLDEALRLMPNFVKVYDEPFADSSALPSLLLNSVAKQHVTVALSGDGGDESFLGYVNFDLLSKFNKISRIPLFIRKIMGYLPLHMLLGGRPETLQAFLKSTNSDEFSWKIFTGFETLQANPIQTWKKNYEGYKKWAKNPLQRMADLNIKLWLENDSNVKVDRASMAFSVEVRSPFLDYRIIEFARTLPVEYRYSQGIKKKILKDILSEYIPEEIFNQPKRGFAIPLDFWLRNDLKEDVLEKLNNIFLDKIPNLDVKKFKQKMQLFFEGKYDYSFIVWRLYVLALWYDEFGFNQLKNDE